ncbi:hypothetical protein L596_021007 [Steinernema carpocapsae]|uniref:Uncharacterized protein n=1 Tax=Steinernema carpocapsae TaxID=34508 RepID=A0A4U5MV78_STECR|nr:hypothetical protein L596_021007 [Steinernema carpocapsae]
MAIQKCSRPIHLRTVRRYTTYVSFILLGLLWSERRSSEDASALHGFPGGHLILIELFFDLQIYGIFEILAVLLTELLITADRHDADFSGFDIFVLIVVFSMVGGLFIYLYVWCFRVVQKCYRCILTERVAMTMQANV